MINFKIGDKVEFGKEKNAPVDANHEIIGYGEILSMYSDHVLVKSWIVLITRRDTDFLKNRPEKALIILDSQMRLLENNEPEVRYTKHTSCKGCEYIGHAPTSKGISFICCKPEHLNIDVPMERFGIKPNYVYYPITHIGKDMDDNPIPKWCTLPKIVVE